MPTLGDSGMYTSGVAEGNSHNAFFRRFSSRLGTDEPLPEAAPGVENRARRMPVTGAEGQPYEVIGRRRPGWRRCHGRTSGTLKIRRRAGCASSS